MRVLDVDLADPARDRHARYINHSLDRLRGFLNEPASDFLGQTIYRLRGGQVALEKIIAKHAF